MPPDDLLEAWTRAGEALAATPADPAAATPPPSPTTPVRDEKSGQFRKADASGATQKPEPAAAAVEADTDATSPAPAKAKDAGGSPAEGKRQQFEALAKELGFELEQNRVTVAERAAFREEKRKAKAAIAQQEAEVRQRLQQEIGMTRQQAAAVAAANKALEAGDFDEFAKALGRKDWNELNGEVLQRFTDPNFKRLRDLEKAHKEREEREQQMLRESQARQQQAAQQQRITAYKQELAQQLAACEDPLAAAFHDDPLFVDAVFKVQREYYQEHGEALPIAEAIKMKPRDGGSPLFEEMRGLYSRLKKAFPEGAQEADRESAAKAAESGRAAELPVRKKVPTSIPQRKATDAAASKPLPVDSKEWMDAAVARMSQAIEKDVKGA
jgi:hypothetical protein